ncbi:class I SAM-dependent methyltransferase [Nocardia sp. NPDC004260]
MDSTENLLDFWESTGSTLAFTHPVEPELLHRYVPCASRVLDYGCGYGRLTAELAGLGYREVYGVDVSAALIERGRREHPDLRLMRWVGFPLPFADEAFDAAVLFAVLTCVPDDSAQSAIVSELSRLVRPDGVLYLSDVPLQSAAYDRERYERFADRFGTYGVFESLDGGVFRHHRPDWLRDLLNDAGFAIAEEQSGPVATLDGRTAERLQIVACRVG